MHSIVERVLSYFVLRVNVFVPSHQVEFCILDLAQKSYEAGIFEPTTAADTVGMVRIMWLGYAQTTEAIM